MRKHFDRYILQRIIVKIGIDRWFVSQELYIKSLYRIVMGEKLNVTAPRTFTEKIQWLKIHDHNPQYHNLVDKYLVRQFIADKIGEKYLIPIIGVWDNFDQINFDTLPQDFVLKTTNGGGSSGVLICRDKNKLDKTIAKKKLESSMANDIYKSLGEWAYKDVKPRIIAEKLMKDNSSYERNPNSDLSDYKFFCFLGEPKFCQVIRDRNTKETIDFYDMNWEHQEFVGLNPEVGNGVAPVPCPLKLQEMINICRELSNGIPFLRVDLYVINGDVYFGELTFYPASGLGRFTPSRWSQKLGEMIDIKVSNTTCNQS